MKKLLIVLLLISCTPEKEQTKIRVYKVDDIMVIVESAYLKGSIAALTVTSSKEARTRWKIDSLAIRNKIK